MSAKQIKQNDSTFIPEKYQHHFSILIIFLSLIIFFNEVIFDNRVFIASDTIASKSFETFSKESAEEGIYPLWNPYIFCGMPGYASLTIGFERTYDISAFILGKINHLFDFISDLNWELFYYLILGIGTYFFAFYKLKNKIASLISALGVMHSTFVIILITVGHMTKVPVIAFFPIIFLLIEKLREKFSIFISLILILAIHFMFLPSHLQMIFYIYFALGIYFLYLIIRSLIKKEIFKPILIAGIVFAFASGIALLLTSDQYFSVIEYSKFSIRGAAPITQQIQSQNSASSVSNSGGLDYEYATNWSFSPEELTTLFVPSFYGFGNHSYKGALTQNQSVRLNTYFGQQPFTDAPQYIGVAIILLAIFGFWKNRREPFVQYLLILIFLSILISFGKFSFLYDLMFNYFPYFNKFRIPSMILILVQLTMPILAGFGVKSILENSFSDAKKKLLFRIFLISSALTFISIIGKEITISIYQSFVSMADLATKFQGADQNNLNAILTIVSDMVASDVTFLFLFFSLIFGLIYFYQTKKIQSSTFTIILVFVILSDLWRINFKPYETHPNRISQQQFQKPEYVNFLLSDSTLYRTVEFQNGQPPYDNTNAFWKIQNAYGYQGAKMRQIQDVFDVVGLNNPLLLTLMNVKYVISNNPDTTELFSLKHKSEKYILKNNLYAPRAFFVDSYKTKSGIEILNSIKEMNFIPSYVAYFMEEPNLKIDPPTEKSFAEFTKYSSQEFVIKVGASGNNLLFISESWYPKGWKAYIDEKEIPIYRLNYMFRGVVVPDGVHTLKMKFEPESFYLGKNLSLWLNILLIGGILFYAIKYFMPKKEK